MNRSMKNIRLTQSDLHRMIQESVMRILEYTSAKPEPHGWSRDRYEYDIEEEVYDAIYKAVNSFPEEDEALAFEVEKIGEAMSDTRGVFELAVKMSDDGVFEGIYDDSVQRMKDFVDSLPVDDRAKDVAKSCIDRVVDQVKPGDIEEKWEEDEYERGNTWYEDD